MPNEQLGSAMPPPTQGIEGTIENDKKNFAKLVGLYREMGTLYAGAGHFAEVADDKLTPHYCESVLLKVLQGLMSKRGMATARDHTGKPFNYGVQINDDIEAELVASTIFISSRSQVYGHGGSLLDAREASQLNDDRRDMTERAKKLQDFISQLKPAKPE